MNAHVEVDAELPGIADAIRLFHKGALDGLKQESDGAAAWRASTLSLARELLKGRQLHQNDNVAFGAWLKASGLDDFLGHMDRAALIGMAEHPDIAATVLEKTARRSWREIWRLEIAPEVERAGGFISPAKTPSGKQKPGRPRQPKADKPAPAEAPASPPAGEIRACGASRRSQKAVGDAMLEGWVHDLEAKLAAADAEIERLKFEHGIALMKRYDEGMAAGIQMAKRELGKDIERVAKAAHEAVAAKIADKLIAAGQTQPTEQDVIDSALGRGPKADPGEVAKLEQQLKAARTRIANLTAERSMAWAAAHASPVSIAKTDRRKILAALHPDGSPSKAQKTEAFQLFSGLKVHEIEA
jgi:hypothetical protein